MTGEITLVPIGGLANRFYAITSTIAFCQDNDIRLKVIWFKDWGMGANFRTILKLAKPLKEVEIVDAEWKDYIFDRPRKRNFWLPALSQRLLFGKRIYEKDVLKGFSPEELKQWVQKYKRVYLVHYCHYYGGLEWLQKLAPAVDIQQNIRNRMEQLFPNNNIIGVHIRRTDNILSIQNSPLSLFIDKMNEEIEKDPTVHFYIASDDMNEKKKLKDLFGDRVITLLEEVRRDNEKGIIDAVMELYTLAAMKKIYGSAASTYSMLAAGLSGIDLEILSIKK